MASRGVRRFFGAVARHWAALTVIGLAAITYLSLLPLDQLPDAPGGDKLHHLVAYALLALPLCLARPARWPAVLALFLAWGAAIEVIQPYVNRYGEWLDFLANATGVLLGLALSFPLRAWLRRESVKGALPPGRP